MTLHYEGPTAVLHYADATFGSSLRSRNTHGSTPRGPYEDRRNNHLSTALPVQRNEVLEEKEVHCIMQTTTTPPKLPSLTPFFFVVFPDNLAAAAPSPSVVLRENAAAAAPLFFVAPRENAASADPSFPVALREKPSSAAFLARLVGGGEEQPWRNRVLVRRSRKWRTFWETICGGARNITEIQK